MIITNLTNADYWFGPMRLPAGYGTQITLDDTSDTSLYLLNDEVADAVNTLYLSSNITVSGQALPFPRPTGTPALLHGDGSPEGLVYGPQGSLYMRRDAPDGASALYTKISPVTQNTGWVSVTQSAMDLLGEVTVETAGPAISFASIQQGYSHLKLMLYLASTNLADVQPNVGMVVNGNEASGAYASQAMWSTGSSVTGLASSYTNLAWVGTVPFFGSCAGIELNLMGYTSPYTVPFTSTCGFTDSAGTLQMNFGGRITTADLAPPITRLDFSLFDFNGNSYDFQVGSVATLYGLAGNAS